jgi:hypothetical protein
VAVITTSPIDQWCSLVQVLSVQVSFRKRLDSLPEKCEVALINDFESKLDLLIRQSALRRSAEIIPSKRHEHRVCNGCTHGDLALRALLVMHFILN